MARRIVGDDSRDGENGEDADYEESEEEVL